MVGDSTHCSACGGGPLEFHLAVAGEMGKEGLVPTTDRYGTALSDIVRCAACGHMQLSTMPAKEILAEAYGDAASLDYVEEEDGQRSTARRQLERLEREVGKGRMLDLGCWVGFLLDEARGRGWRTVGIEPSEFAAGYARERLGLEVLTADLFSSDFEPDSFDAVFMGDVIEHLVDPMDALRRIAGWLRPEGVLALALPDAGSLVARVLGPRWWSVIPTHVQYFTRPSIGRLLERAGMSPIAFETAPKTFSAAYYLGRLGGYSPRLQALARRALSLTGRAEASWTPDFRDRMFVIARQAGTRTDLRTKEPNPSR